MLNLNKNKAFTKAVFHVYMQQLALYMFGNIKCYAYFLAFLLHIHVVTSNCVEEHSTVESLNLISQTITWYHDICCRTHTHIMLTLGPTSIELLELLALLRA